ncbi:H-type lectin domain-containing protein [Scytonema sp. NUACC26]|uniref:H-type lectin domain-containing protein n=1 Tax=Scytonema sp. NUACC26 TaxID=3140176 RepID=UPI0038B39603
MFQKKPEYNDSNHRLTVKPVNVTPTGFDLEYKTWGDSRIHSLWANWVAFGE